MSEISRKEKWRQQIHTIVQKMVIGREENNREK